MSSSCSLSLRKANILIGMPNGTLEPCHKSKGSIGKLWFARYNPSYPRHWVKFICEGEFYEGFLNLSYQIYNWGWILKIEKRPKFPPLVDWVDIPPLNLWLSLFTSEIKFYWFICENSVKNLLAVKRRIHKTLKNTYKIGFQFILIY